MISETPAIDPAMEYQGEREPGVYPALFTKIEPTTITVGATGEEKLLWRWVFNDEQGEMDCLTGTKYTANSNALAMLRGVLGREPRKGDHPNDVIGVKVNCVYGPNKGGTLTITSVLPFKEK